MANTKVKQRVYEIPCSWEVYGKLKIKAPSLQDAIIQAFSAEQGLPKKSSYVEESFKVDDSLLPEMYPGEDFFI